MFIDKEGLKKKLSEWMCECVEGELGDDDVLLPTAAPW